MCGVLLQIWHVGKKCFFGVFLLLFVTWKQISPELNYPVFNASRHKVVNTIEQQYVDTDTCQQLVPNIHTRLLASWLWAVQPMKCWKSTLTTSQIERLLLTVCLAILPLMNKYANCASCTVPHLQQPTVGPGIILCGVTSLFATLTPKSRAAL